MEILKYMEKYGHEQFCVYTDPDVSLRAFICIHDTTLGPALGGVRIWKHATEEEATFDVLRLARAMSFKSAAAGLPLGGGKGLIMADPSKEKTEAMMRSYGRFVESLGGRYVTTEDVGSTTQDIEYVALETSHIVGLPISRGGSGDPSHMTGFGVYQGIKACAKEVWGSDSLSGRTIAMQGFGKVASNLATHLLKEEAKLIVSDINDAALDKVRKLDLVRIVKPDEIYDVECDIFSPNALGGVLNGSSIPRLKCRIVAGGANNQLLTEDDGAALESRGILYAPDYIINAGGVINVSFEMGSAYNEDAAHEKTTRIYETMQQVIRIAKKERITTAAAADRLAINRINSVKRARHVYL